MKFFYALSKIILAPLLEVIYPCKKLGYKEQPYDGATIVVSNHISNFDALVIARCFKGQTYYLCKKEMFKNKLGGWFIRGMGGIKIDREKPEFEEIKTCMRLLKDKQRLMIFPEGTRNKSGDGNLLPLKGGAGMFAFKSKARIIPMYIAGKSRFLRKSYVYVGEPFDLSEFYGKRFNQELSDNITEKIYDKMLECKANYESYMTEKNKGKKK